MNYLERILSQRAYPVIAPVIFLIGINFVGFLTTSCQPKDEKVSTRGANNHQLSGPISTQALEFGDRGVGFSEAALVELLGIGTELSRELETTELEDSKALASCVLQSSVQVPAGMLDTRIHYNQCRQSNSSWEATTSGDVSVFKVLGRNQRPRVEAVRIEATGLDSKLIPTANKKDSVKIHQVRFLTAHYTRSEGENEIYEFRYKTEGNYFLDLKSYTDNGLFKMSYNGYLVVNAKTGRVLAYQVQPESDLHTGFDLKVMSSRQCRNCGSTYRFNQDVRVTGDALAVAPDNAGFKIDLDQCGLPSGLLGSRYTVSNKSSPGKFVIDSSRKQTIERAQTLACSEARSYSAGEFFYRLFF